MARIPRLRLGFSTFRTYNLVSYANHILLCLTGNMYFPTVQATLAGVQAAATAYFDALNNQQRFKSDTYTIAREKRALLLSALSTLGTEVETEAEGDLKKLQTCGISLAKQWQRIGELPATVVKKLVTGQQDGTLLVQAAAVKGANSYVFEYALMPVTKTTEWKSITNTSCKILLTGLTQGMEYGVRVCAIGSNPVRNYSPVVSKYVA